MVPHARARPSCQADTTDVGAADHPVLYCLLTSDRPAHRTTFSVAVPAAMATESAAMQIGGYARDYQEFFASFTAFQS
jgi:hypothetical protein